MLTKINFQPSFPLQFNRLPKEYLDYQTQYEKIDALLDSNKTLIDALHHDIAGAFSRDGRSTEFSSEQFIRMIVVKHIEGLSLRDTIIRIADSDFLRNFTRLFTGPVPAFTTLQSANKAIPAETWEKMNNILFTYAKKNKLITGDHLRVDSTVCESNIHYPTDAFLLWDCYRVIARLIRNCIEEDSRLQCGNRFHEKKIKRLFTFVSTNSNRKKTVRKVRRAMNVLIARVEAVSVTARSFIDNAPKQQFCSMKVQGLLERIEELLPLVTKIVSVSIRAQNGETVPASERVFSIFEPHTELLKRGKSCKPNEFGHLVTLGQTEEKFISFYKVEEKSRHDRVLGDETIRNHKKQFGSYPNKFAADKNYYGGPKHKEYWEKKIPVYSVGKKGRRTEEELQHEHSAIFRLLQKFRAGCEGSISVLKRVFGLYRCLYKGFKSFASSIGSIVFCHNLVLLSRL